jgi:hypothetical protein
MKTTTIFIFVFSIVICLSACQKQHEAVPYVDSNEISYIRSEKEQMLSFDSMDDFYKAALEITEMPYAELEKWIASQGDFVSQWSFMEVIRKEMALVRSWEEALAARKKYEGMYIFNPNEEELDGDPYCPVSGKLYSYLLNKFGDVRIAGRVVNLNDLKTYDEVLNGIDPKTRAWNYNSGHINKVQHQNKSKKRRFRVTSNCTIVGSLATKNEWTMMHQSLEWFLWIGGPTRWHVRKEYYTWPGSTYSHPNGWEPSRRSSGSQIWPAFGKGNPNINAKVFFMTAGLQEEKPMVINHH